MFYFEILKNYCRKTSIHGLRFIFDYRCHFIERIFWFACVVLAFFGVGRLIYESLSTLPVALFIIADNATIRVQFPAVVVCARTSEMEFDPTPYYERFNKTFNDDYTIEDVLRSITLGPNDLSLITTVCGEDPNGLSCIQNGYQEITSILHEPCEKIFEKCSWNNASFRCCDYFLPLPSILGHCYALNSIQTKKQNPLSMINGPENGVGRLDLNLLKTVFIYPLSKEGVPIYSDINRLYVTPSLAFEHVLHFQSITNDPEVRDIPIAVRGCRFPDETIFSVYPFYSYSACVVDCLRTEQLRSCNCTTHHMPPDGAGKRCDLRGVECLFNENKLQPQDMKSWSENTENMICDCLPSCEEPALSAAHSYVHGSENSRANQFEMRLANVPFEVHRRQVVRTKIHLLGCVGGSLGLFMGASILSLAEIPYFLLIRPISDWLKKKVLKK